MTITLVEELFTAAQELYDRKLYGASFLTAYNGIRILIGGLDKMAQKELFEKKLADLGGVSAMLQIEFVYREATAGSRTITIADTELALNVLSKLLGKELGEVTEIELDMADLGLIGGIIALISSLAKTLFRNLSL